MNWDQEIKRIFVFCAFNPSSPHRLHQAISKEEEGREEGRRKKEGGGRDGECSPINIFPGNSRKQKLKKSMSGLEVHALVSMKMPICLEKRFLGPEDRARAQ